MPGLAWKEFWFSWRWTLGTGVNMRVGEAVSCGKASGFINEETGGQMLSLWKVSAGASSEAKLSGHLNPWKKPSFPWNWRPPGRARSGRWESLVQLWMRWGLVCPRAGVGCVGPEATECESSPKARVLLLLKGSELGKCPPSMQRSTVISLEDMNLP